MKDIFDAIQGHWRQQLDSDELHSIHVPEWDKTIYFKAKRSSDQFTAMQLAQQQSMHHLACEVLVQVWRDETGSRVFRSAQAQNKMREVLLGPSADPDVIDRVALEIIRHFAPAQSEEEWEKN